MYERGPTPLVTFGSTSLSQANLKSTAVTGVPSWNFASVLSLKRKTVALSSADQLSATAGTTSLVTGSRAVSPSNSSWMAWQLSGSCASRGSSPAGSAVPKRSTPPATGSPGPMISVSPPSLK